MQTLAAPVFAEYVQRMENVMTPTPVVQKIPCFRRSLSTNCEIQKNKLSEPMQFLLTYTR
jgi:hypothetical protein